MDDQKPGPLLARERLGMGEGRIAGMGKVGGEEDRRLRHEGLQW